jgi:tetratricopeptide (TPR) repeat protein
MALLSLKNYPAAVQPLARACSAMPGDGMARLSYARALKGNGDLKAAVHEYGRAVNHFAGDPQVVREYADALLEKHDYHKSSEYYGIAYRQGLRDERLLLGYSGALSGAGRDKEALPYLEEVYRSDPTGWVTLQLARVMKRLGRYNEARDLLRKIETHSASTAAGK